MYYYSDDDRPRVYRRIKRHVADGQLHPYVGLLLMALIRGEMDED